MSNAALNTLTLPLAAGVACQSARKSRCGCSVPGRLKSGAGRGNAERRVGRRCDHSGGAHRVSLLLVAANTWEMTGNHGVVA